MVGGRSCVPLFNFVHLVDVREQHASVGCREEFRILHLRIFHEVIHENLEAPQVGRLRSDHFKLGLCVCVKRTKTI